MRPRREGARVAGRVVGSLPRATLAGIAVTAVGLLIDVAYHVLDREAELGAPCCGPGLAGHVVTVAGMALALVGVFAFAIRTNPTRGSRTKGGDRARPDLSVR